MAEENEAEEKVMAKISDLEQAIKLLRVQYEVAKKLEWVHNPIAYALYNTWKMADEKWGNK